MASYYTQNQWGGSSAPWHPGGTWVLGCRGNQNVVAINIQSNDNGQTFNGTMTYAGEGPIGVAAQQFMPNNYKVQNSWGSSSGNPGGNWVIGARGAQPVVAMNVSSSDGGNTLTGTITYSGEGPIGFQASSSGCQNQG
jgi:hypothetical protein